VIASSTHVIGSSGDQSFYVGSLAPDTAGQILGGDLRTGTVFELVPPIGRLAAGLKFDSRSQFLFVAGGDSGEARVYDTRSGAEVVSFQFLPPGVGGIINDVVLTREAAHLTDSLRPFLGRVTLNPQGEPLGAALIPLPANFGVPGGCTVGAPIQSNGIAATNDGRELILAHMSEGQLYLVDTATFDPIPIDITGGDFAGGAAVAAPMACCSKARRCTPSSPPSTGSRSCGSPTITGRRSSLSHRAVLVES
jgi:hypothetical protein